MLVKFDAFSLLSFNSPKKIVVGLSGLFLAAMAWNLRRHSHESVFRRIWEVLPGPFVISSNLREERRALNLIESKNGWQKEDILCIESFINKLIRNPGSLQGLDYIQSKKDILSLLKGCFQSYSVDELQAKIEALPEKGRITAQDCGVLTHAVDWIGLLEKLQEKGVTPNLLEPFLNKWKKVEQCNKDLEAERTNIHDFLTKSPARIFLLGKEESRRAERASNLSSFNIWELIKHVFNGNTTHIGFVLNGRSLSNLAKTHEIVDVNCCLNYPCSYIFVDISILPLLPSSLDNHKKQSLQTRFLEIMSEKALIKRPDLHKRDIIATTLGYITGGYTLHQDDGQFKEEEYCTAYIAKILLAALDVLQKETLVKIEPLFNRWQAISRHTVPQLIIALKAKGVIALAQNRRMDQIFDRDRLQADFNHFMNIRFSI